MSRWEAHTARWEIIRFPISGVPEEQKVKTIGKYGLLRKSYLKEHRKGNYQSLLLQGKLSEHLFEVDNAAKKREAMILKQLEESNPLPDREIDQMAWVRMAWVRMADQHRKIAEEIILFELIYV